ncbi:MAG: hypothetical protein HRT35_36325, partial [Algicola sp.]|nr:hypothetical protein [Algicola sp.]
MIFTTNRPLKPLVMLLLALCLSACGGGSSGGGAAGGSGAGGTVETPNVAPTASAGEDQSVNEQTTVTLVGNGTDSDGSISAFAWSQTAGSSVTLTDASSASAT